LTTLSLAAVVVVEAAALEVATAEAHGLATVAALLLGALP